MIITFFLIFGSTTNIFSKKNDYLEFLNQPFIRVLVISLILYYYPYFSIDKSAL